MTAVCPCLDPRFRVRHGVDGLLSPADSNTEPDLVTYQEESCEMPEMMGGVEEVGGDYEVEVDRN